MEEKRRTQKEMKILKSILKPFKAVIKGFKGFISNLSKRNKKTSLNVFNEEIEYLKYTNTNFTIEYEDETLLIKVKSGE